MKRYNYFLPEQVVERLTVIAEVRGVPVSEVIRAALQKYLDDLTAKPPIKPLPTMKHG